MKETIDRDEYLEALWRAQESCRSTIEDVREQIGGDFERDVIDTLLSEEFITIDDDKETLSFTEKGKARARHIIRAHRLAERLMYDAMGMSMEFETGACEFEHTISDVLVNSICTMLGHPKQCPHGLPIPPGECCVKAVRTVESPVVHLKDMSIGETGRIAYINATDDIDLHRLNGLQLRPGAMVKLHQTYPTYVVECEGVNVAIDDEIANAVCVWQLRKDSPATTPLQEEIPRKMCLKERFFGRKNRSKKACGCPETSNPN
jgi:DtxR family Mn-dependent transcriptional regulator